MDAVWPWLQEHWSMVVSVIGAVVSAVFAAFAPVLIKDRVDRRLAERKAELDKQGFEHEVKFKKVHEKTTTVLEKQVELLNLLLPKVMSYLATAERGGGNKAQKWESLDEPYRDFKNHFVTNGIFINDEFVILFGTIETAITKAVYAFRDGLEREQRGERRTTGIDHWEKADKDAEEISDQYKAVRRAARAYLGLEPA